MVRLTHVIVSEIHEVSGEFLRPPDPQAKVTSFTLLRRERTSGDWLNDVGRVRVGGGNQRRGRQLEHVLLEGDWRGGE